MAGVIFFDDIWSLYVIWPFRTYPEHSKNEILNDKNTWNDHI